MKLGRWREVPQPHPQQFRLDVRTGVKEYGSYKKPFGEAV